MKEETRKKIRTQLINFINQEILTNKKNKKSNFLINSMKLEQLEKKNMQCKDFYIKEKDQIYNNNDNGRIIVLNIYINNLAKNNPLINSLSNLLKDNYIINNIKNKDININQTDNINRNKETIIQKQSNKILYIQKEGYVGSPVDTSLLIKKGLGDRKLKRINHEYNSNKMPINRSELSLNKNDNENEHQIIKDPKSNKNINIVNDIDDNLKISKQLSNETLETEISRIIKICHDDRYTNSFDHFPSDSKISQLSREIKIAKMNAKKLKCYCRTLKRKIPINNDNSNLLVKQLSEIVQKNKGNINNDNCFQLDKKNKIINQKDKEKELKKEINNNEEKIKNKKYKKISSLLINLKKNAPKEENNQIGSIKHIIPKKKIMSENLKLKIKRNSFLKIIKDIENERNNNITISSNNNQYRTIEEKITKERISVTKLSKKKRKKTLEKEYKSKLKLKLKKELIKSPLKIIRSKKKKESKRLLKNVKTMKDLLYIITDSSKVSITNLDKKKKKRDTFDGIIKNKILTETNKENNSKNLKKFKKNFQDGQKNRKTENNHLAKNMNKKRGSIDQKINLSGFEKLNFLKTRHKSTQEHLLFDKKRKIKKNFKINNNCNLNNNTSISQQKDSSPSIEKLKRHNKKRNRLKNFSNNKLNFKDKKKKTVGFFKIRKRSAIIEALKKMKRKSSKNDEFRTKAFDFDEEKKPYKTVVDENKKIKYSSTKIKNNFNKDLKELNRNELENDKRENDIFNLMDEFLYKKKHERGKKCNLIE